MSDEGEVRFYLPEGTWTDLLTGERVAGSRWITRTYGFDALPLFVRQGAVIAFGAVDDQPEYDWTYDVRLRWYAPAEGEVGRVRLPAPDGGTAAVLELTLTSGEPRARVLEGACDRFSVQVD
jgi:alpha-D-xyloside xylohydrolase